MKGRQLVLKIALIYGALLFYLSASGQSPDLALKNIQKKKWDHAYALLIKALAKDSLNVTAKYVLAQYFFSADNPAFHLDSAYRHTLDAMKGFQTATPKRRERLQKFPVDSTRLLLLRKNIDSAAYQRAKTLNTERAWAEFVLHFPLSSDLTRAIELRDSAAYVDAVNTNTYEGFLNLLNRYPDSKELKRTRENYQRLLFEEKTSDQTLISYETFLENYPMTPYRHQSERIIFEYVTASGEKDDFARFIEKYPENPFRKKAMDILFHLVPDAERELKWANYFTSDSVRAVIDLKHDYLAPFLRKTKFGFMNKDGVDVIAPHLDSIDQAHLCGNISDDVFSLPDKLIARNGALVWQGKVTAVRDLGHGFLLVEEEACRSVIHKSGFAISGTCVDDAKILSERLLALQQNGTWSIWTLSGRKLIDDLDVVFSIKHVIAMKQKEKFKLITIDELTSSSVPINLPDQNTFDEVKSLPKDLVLVKVGNKYGVVNQTLTFEIGLEDTAVSPSFFGETPPSVSDSLKNPDAVSKPKEIHDVIAYDPWVAIKTDSSWSLYNTHSPRHLSSPYDSIIFLGPFAIASNKDTLRTYFSEEKFLDWSRTVNPGILPGSDSSVFLVIEEKDKKSVYNRAGEQMFKVAFERILSAGGGLFIVEKDGKKGLIDDKGKLILPVVYDAVGAANQGMVSVLRSRKFGLFDGKNKKLIKPEYDKNLSAYNGKLVSAYKNGFYGLISWDNRAVSKFEFDEVKYWNDSAALAKKGSQWMIYEIKTRNILLDGIKKVRLIRDRPNDKLAIIQQGNGYGVVHNRKGTVLPTTFTDLKNLGSESEPLYFTEKHVEEAGIFVVIYYDDEGKSLRQEVYDQEEYERIYCPDN